MSRCRVCNHTLEKFFSLGKMPLVNNFLKESELKNEKKFDLSLGFCPNCYLVQLTEAIAPKTLFQHYLYFSSVTQSILEHSKKTADTFIKRFHLDTNSLVLEVGSNDGVHLQFYKKKGIQVLGIDPAENIANVANERGIKTIPDFFNLKLAKKLVSDGIKADLLYGANVFAHVPEIVDFVQGIELILKEKGTAVFESPYLQGLFENKFDTIYHEHVFYYGLLALQNLFKKARLTIYDVEHIPMQGGSLRIFVCHENMFTIFPHVINLAKEEIKKDFHKVASYKNMERNVKKLKVELIDLLGKLRKEGKRIGGYGAPAKGNVLLNYFGISHHFDFLVDKSIAKQGLYTPGTHMRIYPPSKIWEEKPDYLLILAWNISDEIVNEWQLFKRRGGKFIIPIPKLKVL